MIMSNNFESINSSSFDISWVYEYIETMLTDVLVYTVRNSTLIEVLPLLWGVSIKEDDILFFSAKICSFETDAPKLVTVF